MKKEYSEPQIEVIDGELQGVICVSLPTDSTQDTPKMDSAELEFGEE